MTGMANVATAFNRECRRRCNPVGLRCRIAAGAVLSRRASPGRFHSAAVVRSRLPRRGEHLMDDGRSSDKEDA